jgi:hypothetical protein
MSNDYLRIQHTRSGADRDSLAACGDGAGWKETDS